MLRQVRLEFALAILSGILFGIATGFGLPFMTQKVFPMIFGNSNTDTIQKIWIVSLIPLSFLVRGVSGFFNTYLINYCGSYILEQLRLKVFKKFQELPQAFFQKHTTGDLLSRTITDTELLQNNVVTIANDLVKQPITFLGAVAVLLYLAIQKPELAYVLACLAIIPVCVFPIRRIGKKIQAKAKQMQEQAGSISASVAENLTAAREIRAFNLQESEKLKFTDVIRQFFKIRMKVVKYNNLLNPIIEIISAAGIAAAVFYAAQKQVSLETLTPVIMALYLSYEPLKKLGAIHVRFKQGLAALERIEYVLDHPLEVEDPAKPVVFENVSGKVEFRDVTFSYDANPALKDINVTVNPGQIVALVGPSGAGKTTFANLILRFFDPSQGNLLIDDTDLRNISQNDLRHNIAYVPQNPILFNVSARENILLGQTDNSVLSVKDAAQQAYAHKFIQELPDGYDTRLGEKGSRLSGGQIQRIAIARALLRNAPILILDEATSALDAESEHTIQQALRNLVQDKTVFIIAHRFSTISLANRILVFEEGRIIADGAHDQIIKNCDLYRRLHDGQKTAS
jgi:ATP-binding cassette, subfamily B, bacterial MsbA